MVWAKPWLQTHFMDFRLWNSTWWWHFWLTFMQCFFGSGWWEQWWGCGWANWTPFHFFTLFGIFVDIFDCVSVWVTLDQFVFSYTSVSTPSPTSVSCPLLLHLAFSSDNLKKILGKFFLFVFSTCPTSCNTRLNWVIWLFLRNVWHKLAVLLKIVCLPRCRCFKAEEEDFCNIHSMWTVWSLCNFELVRVRPA